MTDFDDDLAEIWLTESDVNLALEAQLLKGFAPITQNFAAEVRPSPIHGEGVFAVSPRRADDYALIVRCDGQITRQSQPGSQLRDHAHTWWQSLPGRAARHRRRRGAHPRLPNRNLEAGQMTVERGDNTTTIPAHVEDLRQMKGKYLRHLRTDKFCLITDVGKAGVTARDVTPDAYGGEPSGPEYGITWLAIQRLHNLVVDANEIDNIGGGVRNE